MSGAEGAVERESPRTVHLRNEVNPPEYRFLWAYLDGDGALHVDGQDLGPGTAGVSSDGEYEWFQTVRAEHVDRLVALLGGEPGCDILDLLRCRYSGRGSYDLEAILRSGEVPVELFVHGG